MKGKVLIDKHVLVQNNEKLDQLHEIRKESLKYWISEPETGKNKASISGLKKSINEIELLIGHMEGLISD